MSSIKKETGGSPAGGARNARRQRRRPVRLSELARAIGARAPGEADVTGIALDSRLVEPGSLFVALPGTKNDGTAFAREAAQKGAVAVVADRPLPGIPTIVAPDTRAVVAPLAAEFEGRPAERMKLVAVTGTLGKTSTALLLRNMHAAAGRDLGVIGSLGVFWGAQATSSSMTTPDAPALQHALAQMTQAGLEEAALEVTSHALAQKRLAGLAFRLGVLTNLVPDEHLEFHATPEDYLRVKLQFLDLLEPAAPLVLNADDALTMQLAAPRAHKPVRVAWARGAQANGSHADISIADWRMDAGGSRFRLTLERPLTRLDGARVEPTEIEVALPILGVQQVVNFALAAGAALIDGLDAQDIVAGAARTSPIRRRMQVVSLASPTIIDDTVGNPRSLDAVFDTIERLPRRGVLRVLFGVRGMRGPVINRGLGAALARRARRLPCRIVVTASADHAGPRDRVSAEERDAFIGGLGSLGAWCETLDDAMECVAREAAPEDIILLLGAQGMDEAARLLIARLGREESGAAAD
jgi:UDP-N-acetylmuramoyl-L-alanyl-D-glutamate--2,6-diaminopimelate ligase